MSKQILRATLQLLVISGVLIFLINNHTIHEIGGILMERLLPTSSDNTLQSE